MYNYNNYNMRKLPTPTVSCEQEEYQEAVPIDRFSYIKY